MSKFLFDLIRPTTLKSYSVHFAPWYRNPMRLEFATDVKSVITGDKSLEVPVDWVSESEAMDRYLNRGFGNSYDFNQSP